VDFRLAGPGIWRGGYNSGKIKSINNRYLDLEAGINRVAVRSTRKAGKITLGAHSASLQDAAISLSSVAFHGEAPAFPRFTLPSSPERQPVEIASDSGAALLLRPDHVGRYTKALQYSAPYAAIAHVETNLQNGRNAFVDIDSPLADLPAILQGADWVQAANRDASYHAVDFMELTVTAGSTVYIAHDDRLPRPAWLVKDYYPTHGELVVLGRNMMLFAREVPAEAGLTLGPNSDSGTHEDANMYIVFVKQAGK
jgi:beta-galactosidase